MRGIFTCDKVKWTGRAVERFSVCFFFFFVILLFKRRGLLFLPTRVDALFLHRSAKSLLYMSLLYAR